jgi:hypothetical protein
LTQHTAEIGLWDVTASLIEDLDADAAIVAASVPGSWLDRALAASVRPTRLFRYEADGASGLLPGLRYAAPLVVVGDCDRDIPEPAPRLWPLARSRGDRRLRALDTLLGTAHRVGLLVIEAPAAIDRVVAGAAQIVARDTPTVIAGWGGLPRDARPGARERLVARIGNDYSWFDGEAGVSVGVRSPTAWRPRPHMRHDRAIVPVDQDLPCRGLYDAETGGGAAIWRWSGPGRGVALAVPLPGPGRWRLWLDVLAWGSAAGPRDLTVFADGQRLDPVPMRGRGATYADFHVADARPLVRIDIVTPPTRRASEDDPRLIGINLTQVGLFRVGSDMAVEHATGVA